MPPLLEEMQAGLAGRYTLERELGRGGMATVFLARDVRHGRNVAIKVLNPDIANAVGAARFTREIHLAANLIHPHILPLLDSGEVPVEGGPSRLWYATPFVAGDSLRARLSRERQLPVAEAVRIAVEIADALDYAHRQGFLHRDIKPENVLLQDGHALVADLGIGRAIDQDKERLTGTGLLLGTPAYMSPEQAGGAAVDGRTDVYSLGCVLYEMLTGSPAFSGPTPAVIVARVMSSIAPPPVHETRPTAAALDPILRKAMAPVPADRFASGREFAAALSETAPEVRPVDEGEVRGRRSAARRLLPALGLLVALAGGWWAWAAGLFAARAAPGGPGEGGVPTIAVLPIEMISERPEDRAFADAMHVQLIDELQSIRPLVVLDRRAMLEYRDNPMSSSAIAAAVGATHVVDATATIADGAVRISPRLFDRAGRSLWREQYTRPKADVFALQAEVARVIAAEIEGVLLSESNRPVQTPVDTAAFRLYAHGLGLFEAGGPNRTVEADSAHLLLDSASAAFERATELDPSFALAWAYLASSRQWRASAAPQALADSLYPRSLDAADRAIGLNKNEWLAWAARGFTLTRTWKLAEARAANNQASALNENAVHAHLGHFHTAVGELRQAGEAFYQAYLRDPNWPLRRGQAAYHLACAGSFDRALDIADPALMSPDSRSLRAGIYVRQGRFEEAVREFEAQVRPGELPPPLMPYAYLKAGNPERAIELAGVRQSAGLSDLEDDLVLGDTTRIVDRIRAAADSRDQSLLWLKCLEIYPELVRIPQVRAIIDELDLPGS